MKHTILKKVYFLTFFFACIFYVHAGEASTDLTAEFNVTSRTSFGVDLDNPYRFGLKQEFTDFNFILHLTPYQKLTNRVNGGGAVGFINLTFFNLDLMSDEALGYNAGVPDSKAFLMRNRFQTGEFIAGIAYNDWIFQMNAGANEPSWSPWNKGIQFTNDKVKFSWAYLDSVVDVKRTQKVSELKPQDPVVQQFQQDGVGPTDQFGLNITGATVAALYNKEDVFGLNLKLATEYPYDSEGITETNRNGIAAGVDAVITPPSVEGLKILASTGGSVNYGKDANSDPFMFGVKAGYNIYLNEDISLEPYAGFDGGLKFMDNGGTEPFEYEASCGLTMRWPGQAGWFTDYILNKDGRVFPGVSLAYSIYGKTDDTTKANQSVKFTLFEPRGDDGVFYGLGSEMIVDVTHIGQDDWNLFTTLYFDYEVPGVFNSNGKLVPWITLCYDNVPYAGGERENALKTDVGINLDGVITNTVFGIAWNSGNLIPDKSETSLGFVKSFVEIKF